MDYTKILKAESKKAIATLFRDSGDLTRMAIPAKLTSPNVQVPKFTRKYDYSLGNSLRGPGAKPVEIMSNFEFESIMLRERAVSQPVDIQDIQNLNMIGQSVISAHVINNLVEVLTYDMHKELVSVYQDDTNFAVLDLTVAGSTKWDVAGATPRADFDTALGLYRARFGRDPNTLIISRDIISSVKNVVTDWTTFWQLNALPDGEEDQLRKYFGGNLVQNVIIPKVYKGTDGSYQDFYTETFVLAYIEPSNQGAVIGDITANRSPIRLYFLDQSYDFMDSNSNNKSKGFVSNEEGLLIKMWEYPTEGGYMKKIDAKCNWKMHVANPYALTKIKNMFT
jgi:hypothetical protein